MYCFFASPTMDTLVMVKARPSEIFCWTVRNVFSFFLANRIWPMQYSVGSCVDTRTQEKVLPVLFWPCHVYSYSSTRAWRTTTVHAPNSALRLFSSRKGSKAGCAALPNGGVGCVALLSFASAFGAMKLARAAECVRALCAESLASKSCGVICGMDSLCGMDSDMIGFRVHRDIIGATAENDRY